MEDDFVVYRSCIKDIGLMPKEAAYGIVFCYGNMTEFLKMQDKFLHDLPEFANGNLLGTKAKDLSVHEMALARHIERIVPLLAAQSEALPFSHS